MNYKEVIESRYNRQNWQLLLHDIFGNKIKFWNTPSTILTSSQFAKQALWLGTITLSDNQTISIYEVELSDSVDIERNRRGIRDMLLTDWRNNGNAGAFMFCYRKNESVLRFSYVSEAWTFADDGSYQKESTDAKRFTYLLGEGHRSRTAIQQFEKLRDSSLTLKDLTKAFSVDAVSDMFFKGYKQQYEDIIFFITGKRMVKVANKWEERQEGKPNAYIMQQFAKFDNQEKAIRDYVKKLMGRLVFLQFLQKKGWLGVPAGAEWGTGDAEFIQNLFAQTADKDHFIDNVLEALFNDLNSEDEKQLPQYRTPYLNGGLFERDVQDETNFPLPGKYMKQMLDFFSSYNFTIDENDPDDAEVGVDPEMLGRIFENLLEDNKDKGAFYTPKEIVSYMCRESLIAYLQTNIEDEATKEALRQFVTTHDVKALGTNDKFRQQVDEALKNVKICDPAIGSGAFPMGLLKELFLCRTALEGITQSKAAEIKKHIIQQNIYGVDIERGAVDIARLRFWLSLIVDEETPQALPNLDFKIMQGNSLLEQYKGVDLSAMTASKWNKTDSLLIFDNMLDFYRQELRKMIHQYYDCTNHNAKVSLKRAIIDNVKKQMKEQHIDLSTIDLNLDGNSQFFLWHTWFYDVFSQGGFDITIGNPPYGAKTTLYEKSAFKKIYNSAKTIAGKQKGSTDTFSIFIDFGYQSIKIHGVSMFIVPLSITASDAMSGLHKLLIDNCKEICVSSYGDRPKRIFESAEQQVSIIGFRKTGTTCRQLMSTPINKRYSDESLWVLLGNLKFINVLKYVRNGRIPKVGDSIELNILEKLHLVKTELSGLYYKNSTPIYYRKAGGRYYKVIMKEPTHSAAEGNISVPQKYANLVGASLSSNLFYWFWLIHSDWHNLRTSELAMFPIPYQSYTDRDLEEIGNLYDSYLKDLQKNSKTMKSGLRCFYARKSKSCIDKIDKFIGKKYGLTDNEIEYIINYDIRYRNSDE
ncbi:Eco57I restriction-modification methylase domain-containing protein [Prevotella sp. E9-3]|uniref:Eco57I restriction-modification methylase domain-containing protein n=1 Tax=Prevotella sp. E9-3 TaxID=2913621 RepID=UPI001EDA2A77|nr:DNA methyltransferase [Prevotella sp. E9-3]UKK48106.1 Eco57I restriction-modification methylase domain-containing protein [Prevotella sp. E9-3]